MVNGVKGMNHYTGSDFDDFLAEEGLLEEVTARARDGKQIIRHSDEAFNDHVLATAILGWLLHHIMTLNIADIVIRRLQRRKTPPWLPQHGSTPH